MRHKTLIDQSFPSKVSLGHDRTGAEDKASTAHGNPAVINLHNPVSSKVTVIQYPGVTNVHISIESGGGNGWGITIAFLSQEVPWPPHYR